MKKFLYILLFFSFILILTSNSKITFASSKNDDFLDNTYEIIDELDTSKLEDIFVNNEYYNSILGNSFKEKLKNLISQDIPEESFLKYITKVVFVDISKFLPFFIILFIIAVLSGMIETIKPDGKSYQMSNIIYLVCYLCCITILLGQFIKTSQEIKIVVSNVSNIMQIIMPLLLTLMSVSGMTNSVAIYRPIVLVLSNGLISFILSVLIPLVTGITVLNIISQLTDKIKLNKLKDVLSLLFKWIIGLSLTVFSFFLTVKGLYSSRSDGISLTAIKYLTGQVPIVGGFLKEGTDIFIASSLLIKNALGKMSVFIIFWELISPSVSLLVIIFGLNIIAGISEPFADCKIVNCYSNIAKVFSNFLAIILMSSFMFVLTIIMIITSGSVA